MKTIHLLLLGSIVLFLFPFYSFSQEIGKHKIYIFQREFGPNTYSSIDEVKSISEVGDSILMEIEHDNEIGNRVKDSLWSYENKIYIHDVLLYDYNLQVGDSFISNDFLIPTQTFTYVVKSIDTIIGINGEKIARWQLKHKSDWLTWHKNYGEKMQGWFYRPWLNAMIGTNDVLAICKQDTLVYWRDSVFPKSATPSCDFEYLDTYLGIKPTASKSMDCGLYPNPTSGSLTVALPAGDGHWVYQITDATVRMLQQGSLSREQHQIPTHALPVGVYQLHLHNIKNQYYENHSFVVVR
jgi:hypothetical protein